MALTKQSAGTNGCATWTFQDLDYIFIYYKFRQQKTHIYEIKIKLETREQRENDQLATR